jgi:hypothetical protein
MRWSRIFKEQMKFLEVATIGALSGGEFFHFSRFGLDSGFFRGVEAATPDPLPSA